MTDEKTLFFGKEKINLVQDGADAGYKRITTDSGSFDVPEWELTACVSEEPMDLSELQEKRALYVVGEWLKLLHSLDVKIEDIGYFIQKLIGSLQESEEKAKLMGLGFKLENYKMWQEARSDIRMSTLDKKLKS